MKVLIIKLSSIGDVVHTLPALTALRQGLGPRAQIDWLIEEPASGILKRNRFLNNVIIVGQRGWTRHTTANIKTSKWLRLQKYDVVIDFQGLLKSAAWVVVSKGVRKVGFTNAREMSSLFLNEKLPPYDPDRHAIDRYLDLARHVTGKPFTAQIADFFPRPDESALANANAKLIDAGLPAGSGFFVIIPRARWSTKLWDDMKFIGLAKKVIASTGLYAVLSGTRADATDLDSMKAAIGGKAVNMAGLLDLSELSTILSQARFAVTVDSGPMHMAVAAGTRVIALFGPTAPWRTGPYGEGNTVIRTGVECSPCFKKICNDAQCMKAITVEDVWGAVKKTWQKCP